MPLYMDVHEHLPEGATAADVAKAHEADLAKQGEYGVNYKSYWVDDKAGKVFCLVEAPDAETAARVHREAHGLVADHICEVDQGEARRGALRRPRTCAATSSARPLMSTAVK